MTKDIKLVAVEMGSCKNHTTLIFTYKGYYTLLNRTANMNTGEYKYSCGLEDYFPLLLRCVGSIYSHMPYCQFREAHNSDADVYKDCIEYINGCARNNKHCLDEIIEDLKEEQR